MLPGSLWLSFNPQITQITQIQFINRLSRPESKTIHKLHETHELHEKGIANDKVEGFRFHWCLFDRGIHLNQLQTADSKSARESRGFEYRNCGRDGRGEGETGAGD